MRLDDLKYEFPKMPKEMKEMIEREVEKQVKTEYPQFKKNRKLAGRTIAAAVTKKHKTHHWTFQMSVLKLVICRIIWYRRRKENIVTKRI